MLNRFYKHFNNFLNFIINYFLENEIVLKRICNASLLFHLRFSFYVNGIFFIIYTFQLRFLKKKIDFALETLSADLSYQIFTKEKYYKILKYFY